MTRLELLAAAVIRDVVDEDIDLMGVMEMCEDLDEDDARAVLALVRSARISVTWEDAS